MKPELFITCDFATDQGGKLTLVGVFDRVATKALPAGLGTLGIGLRMRLEEADLTTAPHALEIRLLSPNGQSIATLNGSMVTQRPAGWSDVAEAANAQLAFNMFGVRFLEFGRYQLELYVDGKRLQTVPIFVSALT